MIKTVLCLGLAAFALTGCSGRFMGFDSCDSKNAVVWFQQPAKDGQYHDEAFHPCTKLEDVGGFGGGRAGVPNPARGAPFRRRKPAMWFIVSAAPCCYMKTYSPFSGVVFSLPP